MSRLRPHHPLRDLQLKSQQALGNHGRFVHRDRDDAERLAALHEYATAKLAYNIAKMIDDSPAPFTEVDQAYICEILAGRVNEDD